jgi:hypothetical protein
MIKYTASMGIWGMSRVALASRSTWQSKTIPLRLYEEAVRFSRTASLFFG